MSNHVPEQYKDLQEAWDRGKVIFFKHPTGTVGVPLDEQPAWDYPLHCYTVDHDFRRSNMSIKELQKAHQLGETIECVGFGGKWTVVRNPRWDGKPQNYRVRPVLDQVALPKNKRGFCVLDVVRVASRARHQLFYIIGHGAAGYRVTSTAPIHNLEPHGVIVVQEEDLEHAYDVKFKIGDSVREIDGNKVRGLVTSMSVAIDGTIMAAVKFIGCTPHSLVGRVWARPQDMLEHDEVAPAKLVPGEAKVGESLIKISAGSGISLAGHSTVINSTPAAYQRLIKTIDELAQSISASSKKGNFILLDPEFAKEVVGTFNLPTQKENTMLKFETKYLVNGADLDSMSNDRLYDLIARAEKEIEELSNIKNKPARLKKEIAERQSNLNSLVAHLDERDSTASE